MRRSLVALVVLLSSACASEGQETSVADRAAAGVCDAMRAAEIGNDEAAKAAFDDEAHTPLHDLTDAVDDRKVKGSLLEAKGNIENGDRSPRAFKQLERAISDAAERAGFDRPEPCDG